MGGVKRIMITGASGFIGRQVVQRAVADGYEVIAVVRSRVPNFPREVEVLKLDLAASTAVDILTSAMKVDAVIHAAAHVGNDPEAQERDSLRGTETVLSSMSHAGVKRLVLVSSMAVYDTSRLWPGQDVTEDTPLEDPRRARDAYTRAKLLQEDLCYEAADRRGLSLAVLRPGAVYGPGQVWNAHVGAGLGPVLFRFASGGELPLCHVSTCATALVAAADSDWVGDLNVLDSNLPDRRDFSRALRKSGWPRVVIPFPWWLLLIAGYGLSPVRRWMPGLLRPRILKARMMPLRYPRHVGRTLHVPATAPFQQLLERSLQRRRK